MPGESSFSQCHGAFRFLRCVALTQIFFEILHNESSREEGNTVFSANERIRIRAYEEEEEEEKEVEEVTFTR